jgi:hypothetical protein
MGRRACRLLVPDSGAKQTSRKAPGSDSGVAEVLALVRISLSTRGLRRLRQGQLMAQKQSYLAFNPSGNRTRPSQHALAAG